MAEFEFREEILAGGNEGDFATVRHIILKGSNYDIGKKLCEIASSRYDWKPRPGIPHVTSARRKFFAEEWTHHYERMTGIADYYGKNLDNENYDFGSLLFLMDFPMEPGCSVVYYPSQKTDTGSCVLCRNYDFPLGSVTEVFFGMKIPGLKAMTADPYLIEVFPESGFPSIYMTAYDLLGCIDGMNSEGLTVAMLADDISNTQYPAEHASDQVGINEVQILRFLLDTCSTVDEAIDAVLNVKNYYGFVRCHFIIGDKHGNSFIYERGPFQNREMITQNNGNAQVVTNHLVGIYPDPMQLPEIFHQHTTVSRFCMLRDKVVKSGDRKFSKEEIKEFNRSIMRMDEIPDTMDDRAISPGRTLWQAVYDANNLSVDIDFYIRESDDINESRSGYFKFENLFG